MNDWIGVYGTPDPAAALRSLGHEACWHDRAVAFGGAPVGMDASGQIVVCGDVLLDNADDLRRALERPGAAGGELLAELYLRYGADLGQHALGMFAAAVWDTRQRRLLLLRDGVGARTLYYAREGGAWWFAARLRTLRRTPAVGSEISPTALRAYLTCAFVPGAETLWRDASELRPGTTLTLPDGTIHSYWEPAEAVGNPAEPAETHPARLRALLEEAVRVCLPASGPVGVFLSGGLDSSLVTALAAREAPGPVHTYAIHFGEEYPNELEFSNLVARHCGTCHQVLTLPGRLIQEKLMETMVALDDPIGDPLTVPNLLLGRAAAQDTDVILNGEGGDPCFGGPKNLPMLLHELYAPSGQREAAYLRSFQKCYDDMPRLLTPDVQAELRKAPPLEALLTPFLSNPDMTHFLNRLMHVNVRLKGADHILTKVANLTSATGLLGRSPLFDRRIVEASFAIPPACKLAGADEKAVLKAAVADLLPESILKRPKSGMLVPVQGWFRRELRRFARSLLLGRGARTRPYLNREVVSEWLAYRGNLWPRHGVKLWLLLTLEVWLRAQE
jgi:asparagine synthase (glutamine-hydrolysing)